MLRRILRGLLYGAALIVAGTASAEVVTFEFCGHTKGALPMAREGTPVIGRFSWDVAASGSMPYPGAPQTHYQTPDTGAFSFLVGRHQVSADSTGVTVWNDTGSNVGDMIDINGYSPVIDGTLFRSGYFSMRLASAAGNTSVFDDMQLPSELDLASFDSTGMNYFQLYSGVAVNELLLDVNLAWIRRAGPTRPGESERRLCLPHAGS